jgi:polyisoprenoid-binding protein YceI
MIHGLLLLMLSASGFADAAAPSTWSIDPARSRLEFTTTYESEAIQGVFKRFDTRLVFDPQQLSGSELEVTVDVTSADMDSQDVNEAIQDKDWFSVSRHPKASFTSTTFESAGPDRYLATGTLTVKGISREVTVPFRWSSSGDRGRMEGTVTLDRRDFGVGEGEWATGDVIGVSVEVRFDVALTRGSG